jgi:glutamine amidotransferase
MPDDECLHNGAIFNDDGHGYAIVDVLGNRIIVDRGMDARDMIKSFVDIRSRFPDGPALFHSRLATNGLINLLNTHPFPVGGDSRTVLAHNGIMPLQPSKTDPRSDTRIVAESHIPRAFGTLRRRRARLAFERWMGPWNKVVILTVDPRFRDNAFILHEKEGIWHEGAWYSNDMYQGWSPSKYRYAWDDGDLLVVGTRALDEPATRCWYCREPADYSLGECRACGYCFDCGSLPATCVCYVPTRRLDHQGT